MSLTKRQEEVYNFIRDKMLEDGYPPSIREICAGLGVRSTSTIHAHLSQLEDKGYLKRDGTKNRAIVLNEEYLPPTADSLAIPLVGRVQAGTPILAVENIEDYLPVPPHYLAQGEHFFLRVQGESMKDAGIFDGDYVLVKETKQANNGEMVVALLDEETTVKTYYLEQDHIRLQPENDAFEPIRSTDVEILGTVAAVMRFIR